MRLESARKLAFLAFHNKSPKSKVYACLGGEVTGGDFRRRCGMNEKYIDYWSSDLNRDDKGRLRFAICPIYSSDYENIITNMEETADATNMPLENGFMCFTATFHKAWKAERISKSYECVQAYTGWGLDIDYKDLPKWLQERVNRDPKKLWDYFKEINIDSGLFPHPSAVISSGRGGLHIYWFLQKKLSNPFGKKRKKMREYEAYRRFRYALRGAFISDKKVTPIQWLRIPDTVNIKGDEINECKEIEMEGIVYTLEEMAVYAEKFYSILEKHPLYKYMDDRYVDMELETEKRREEQFKKAIDKFNREESIRLAEEQENWLRRKAKIMSVEEILSNSILEEEDKEWMITYKKKLEERCYSWSENDEDALCEAKLGDAEHALLEKGHSLTSEEKEKDEIVVPIPTPLPSVSESEACPLPSKVLPCAPSEGATEASPSASVRRKPSYPHSSEWIYFEYTDFPKMLHHNNKTAAHYATARDLAEILVNKKDYEGSGRNLCCFFIAVNIATSLVGMNLNDIEKCVYDTLVSINEKMTYGLGKRELFKITESAIKQYKRFINNNENYETGSENEVSPYEMLLTSAVLCNHLDIKDEDCRYTRHIMTRAEAQNRKKLRDKRIYENKLKKMGKVKKSVSVRNRREACVNAIISGDFTYRELMNKFGVSKPTIWRDVNYIFSHLDEFDKALREFNPPIDNDGNLPK